VEKCYEKNPKSMGERLGDVKKIADDILAKVKDVKESISESSTTAENPTQDAAEIDPLTQNYPFIVKGGRPYHSRIGVAEPPPAEDCPGGQWMLLDTQWQFIGYRKSYVLPGWENYTKPGPRPGVIGFFKDVGGVVSDLWDEFRGKPIDGRYEDNVCDYIADHTFQCSTKLDLVKNIEQRKTVDHQPCYTKA
jgi:hypothetical protein